LRRNSYRVEAQFAGDERVLAKEHLGEISNAHFFQIAPLKGSEWAKSWIPKPSGCATSRPGELADAEGDERLPPADPLCYAVEHRDGIGILEHGAGCLVALGDAAGAVPLCQRALDGREHVRSTAVLANPKAHGCRYCRR
jgi:hypothetical protein